jgi:outer membrane protein assembly factor BamB
MHTRANQEVPMSKPFPIEREIVLAGVKNVCGVTHDGTRLWAACDGALVAIDPDRGIEIARYELGCDAGIAWDGTALWVISDADLHRVDPETGKILSTMPCPEGGEVSGLAYAEGFLWFGRYRKHEVLKVDPKTGTIVKRIQRDRFVTGVSFADGALWHGSVSDDKGKPAGMLHCLDPETGKEQARFPYPDSMWVSGLELDAKNKRTFWAGGHEGGVLRVLALPKR